MRRLLLGLTLALSLGGCANLQGAWSTLTSASITENQVYIARNAFDALEISSANYISKCKSKPTTYGCSKSAINELIPAVRSGRIAREDLKQFAHDHPGQFGTTGLYDALVTSTSALQKIAAQYNIGAIQ